VSGSTSWRDAVNLNCSLACPAVAGAARINETHHPVKLVGTGVTHRVLTLGGGFGVAAFLAARVVAGRLS